MSQLTRRQFAAASAAAITLGAVPHIRAADGSPGWRLATFAADITPPIGHPLIGGLRGAGEDDQGPAERPRGRLVGSPKPLVICGLDWCELRNDAYDRWKQRYGFAPVSRIVFQTGLRSGARTTCDSAFNRRRWHSASMDGC